MTDKQKKFCDEYLIDCNGTQAAVRAGYSPKTARTIASHLMNKPYIRELIDTRLDELHSEKIADAAEVIEYLTSVMRGEHSEQILRPVGSGKQEIDSISVSVKERLKAAELIGKRYGLFRENVRSAEAVPVVICDDVRE